MRLFWQEICEGFFMMSRIHRQAVFTLILVPVLYTLFFGGLFYKNTLTDVPVFVVNLDNGESGSRLARDFTETPEISVVGVTGDAYAPKDAWSSFDITGIIVIPKDFSARLATGGSAQVELIVDNANTVQGGTVSRAVQSVLNAKNVEAVIMNRSVAGWSESQAAGAGLSVSPRVLYNPTGGYVDFFLAALIFHAGQIATVFVLGPALALEKKFRRDAFLNYPWRVLLAKTVLFTILETSVIAFCLGIAMGGFGMMCRSSGTEILLLTGAYIFSVAAFGFCMGAWVSVPYRAITYSLFYIMPSVLFTGAIWPRSSMDNFSLILSYLLPIGYVANDARNLLVKGTASDWEFDIAILMAFGAFFLFLAVRGLKHSLKTDSSGGVQDAQNYAQGMETLGS